MHPIEEEEEAHKSKKEEEESHNFRKWVINNGLIFSTSNTNYLN